MKKFLTVAALIWVFFLLQTSVCPWIAFGSIKPNLLVILIASIGFMEGSKAGMWTGFACGLLADLFAANGVSLISQNGATGDLLGFYALLFLYVGYLCGQANRLFYPEDIKLPLMMIAAADLCVNFVCYLIMFLMRARLSVTYHFTGSSLHNRCCIYFLSAAFAAAQMALVCGSREYRIIVEKNSEISDQFYQFQNVFFVRHVCFDGSPFVPAHFYAADRTGRGQAAGI